MPSVRIAWRDVLIGAAGTALLFSLGKALIGLYIGTSSVTSGFGAASSLVVLPLWVYYSAQIFLVGAEFTWLYAQRHGSMAGRAEAAVRNLRRHAAGARARAAGLRLVDPCCGTDARTHAAGHPACHDVAAARCAAAGGRDRDRLVVRVRHPGRAGAAELDSHPRLHQPQRPGGDAHGSLRSWRHGRAAVAACLPTRALVAVAADAVHPAAPVAPLAAKALGH